MRRRTMIAGLAAMPIASMILPAEAAATVAIVVGYSAGGSTDIIARILAPRLSEKLDRTVIVEDRPGASAQIASKDVARSAPDGNVLQIATQTSHAVGPALYPHVGYDPVKDFTPIALVAWAPLVLICNVSLPVKSVKDLIAYDKAQHGAAVYATGGRGDGSDMAALLFNNIAHIKAIAVPYQGDGAAMPAVVGGHVPYMFCLTPTAHAALASGEVRALAVTSKVRSSSFRIADHSRVGFPWL